jgi:two-component system, cell cycle sensor histidine kinase and response regulator CckA
MPDSGIHDDAEERRLLAVGRLAGGVAHDFNNSLTGIMGYAALAQEELEDDAPLHGMLEQIIKGAERAASLARHLLTFARKRTAQPRSVDLNSLVGEMERMLRRVLRENVELEIQSDEELGFCRLDPTHVEQVLVHLVVDAGDTLHGGGVVTIRTCNVEEADGASSRVGFVVAGRSADAACEPSPGGALGLDLAREIIEACDGSLSISDEANGPTYDVSFPQIENPTTATAPRGFASSGGTILLVDDEEIVLRMAGEVLTAAGNRVLAAADPERAITVCREHDGDIQLLLTDVVMPGMSGPRLAERIRALRPGIRVLFMSGYPDTVLEEEGGLEAGAKLLEKPFAPSHLTRTVRDLLGQG